MRLIRAVSSVLLGGIAFAAAGCGSPPLEYRAERPPNTAPGDLGAGASEVPTYGARVALFEGGTQILAGRADVYVVDAEPTSEGACLPSTMVQFAGLFSGVQPSWLVLGRSLSTSDVGTSSIPRRSIVNVTIEAPGHAVRAYASSVRVVGADTGSLRVELITPTLCTGDSIAALDAIEYWPTDSACAAETSLTLALDLDQPQATALCGAGTARQWKLGDDDLCWTQDVRDCTSGRDIRTGELPPDPATDQD